MEAAVLIGLFVVTFLLGSIPWGVIIGSKRYHTDIRSHGSGNIGTTNAMRTFGKGGGVAVFLLDFGKGLASGLLGWWAAWWFLPWLYSICVSLAFMGCVFGHIYSPWLGFKGGKGIAVAIGALFVTFGAWGAILELAFFVVFVAITKYVSAGSLASSFACPFIAAWVFWGQPVPIAICTLTALVVIYAHRENIGRLIAGTERKIGAGKKGDATVEEELEDEE